MSVSVRKRRTYVQMESADDIFLAARQITDPAERQRYLANACANDTEVRQRVEQMLREAEKADDFFGPQGTVVVSQSVVTEGPGTVIGQYKLLQKIGEGGMGVVYMAEQRVPVVRKVALKIVKLGMDTRQVVARFEAERQALALMDHPNIARVLEAGATETGRPYFVMELVRGIKITEYCDQNHLSTEERLDLFIKICGAVQHAHQKGIIHRDIKPSNILVADHDGVPVPKIIDFGIAKATTGQPLTDKTVFTEFEQFIGTPAYMSPEQAKLSGLDIDTRTDIYSLGVLLYELLTGQTPFDPAELLMLGLEEMRRTIREQEPARPSTRLNTMVVAELTTTAKNRQTDPPKLVHEISGDLDWIVMKCLAKDRSRRYETANALSMDVQRHIKNEAILARPPSKLYEFQKSVQRHRFGFAAAASLILVLSAGIFISTKQAVRAMRAEKTAQAEADKSKEIAKFLVEMLRGVGPSVAQGRDTTMLREILDKTAERVRVDLQTRPEVQVELLTTIAHTYLELGLVDKAESSAREAEHLSLTHFGQTTESRANALFEVAAAISRRSQKNKNPEAEATIRQALAIWQSLSMTNNGQFAYGTALLAGILRAEGRLQEAENASRQALAMRANADRKKSVALANSYDNLALILRDEGKLDEAEKMLRTALEIYPEPKGDLGRAQTFRYLSGILKRQGKLDETAAVLREEYDLRLRLLGPAGTAVALTLRELTETLYQTHQEKEALSLQRAYLTELRKHIGDDDPRVADNFMQLARLLKGSDLAETEAIYRQVISSKRKQFGNESPEVLSVLTTLADIMYKQGKSKEGEELRREILSISRKLHGDEHINTIHALEELGVVFLTEGKFSEAEAQFRESLPLRRKLQGDSTGNAYVLRQLGYSLIRQEKFREAEPFVRECLSIHQKIQPDHWETFSARVRVAWSLMGQKRYSEAEPLLIDGFQGLQKREATIPETDKGRINEALRQILVLYKETGQKEQLAKWKHETGIIRQHAFESQAKNDDPLGLNNLAWHFATSELDDLRDGTNAVALAEKAVALSGRKKAMYLDTLAAAYAEVGDFDKAVATQREAISRTSDEEKKRDGYDDRLNLYQSHKPFRQPLQ